MIWWVKYFVTRRLVSQEPQKKQQQANIHPSDLTLPSTLVVVSWWQLLHWTWAGSWPNILSGSTTVMGMGTLVSIMSLLLLSGENNKVMRPQRRERKIYWWFGMFSWTLSQKIKTHLQIPSSIQHNMTKLHFYTWVPDSAGAYRPTLLGILLCLNRERRGVYAYLSLESIRESMYININMYPNEV